MALDVSTGHLMDPRTGVPIRWATTKVTKDWWLLGTNTVTLELLPSAVVGRTVAYVQEAMALYPADLLTEHLKSIYLGATVKQADRAQNMLGLAWQGAVYISNRRRFGGERQEIHRVFHHEFAHVLQRGPFLKAFLFEWIGEGEKRGHLLRRPKAEPSDTDGESLWKDGFLRMNGRKEPFEDFCHYAEGLFMGDPEFWRLVDEYPKVRRKAGLMIELYSRVDPQFCLSFFEGLKPPA